MSLTEAETNKKEKGRRGVGWRKIFLVEEGDYIRKYKFDRKFVIVEDGVIWYRIKG